MFDILSFSCPFNDCGRPSYSSKTKEMVDHEAMAELLKQLTLEDQLKTELLRDTTPVCFACEENIANKYCEECGHHYCGECDVVIHQAAKKMKSHVRVSVEENIVKRSKLEMPKCVTHTTEQCIHYCCCDSNRHQFVCEKCVTDDGDHVGHQLKSIQAAAEEKKTRIESTISKLFQQENELRRMNDELLTMMKELDSSFTETIKQVYSKYDDLIRLLLTKRDETVGSLRQDRFDREESCIQALDTVAGTLGELIAKRQGLEMRMKSAGGDGTATGTDQTYSRDLSILQIDCQSTLLQEEEEGHKSAIVSNLVNSVKIPVASSCIVKHRLNDSEMLKLRELLIIGPPAPVIQSIGWSDAVPRTVDISWSPSLSYHVELRCLGEVNKDEQDSCISHNPSEVDWSGEDIYWGNATSCSASGLIPGRNYEVRVCSELETGEYTCRGPWSLQTITCTKNSFAPFSWNTDKQCNNITVDGLTAGNSNIELKYWGAVLASTGLTIAPNIDQMGYFEVTITGNVMVGLASLEFTTRPGNYCGCVGSTGESMSWQGASAGRCHSRFGGMEGFPDDISRRYKDGDLVGIFVDCRGDPSMSWYVNKKRVYNCVLPSSVHNITLFPAISLYSVATAKFEDNPDLPLSHPTEI